MGTAEERLRILKLLEEGKVSADEATSLLQALSVGSKAGRTATGREARWLRVRITDTNTGQVKVSINIPMGLVRTGLRMGARFVPGDADVDYQELTEAIEGGETGKIFDYTDNEQAEQVEVWAE